MRSVLSAVNSYFSYYISAKTEHAIHSPFLYEVVTKIRKKESHPIFKNIEKLRKDLLANDNELTLSDLGAGSKHGLAQKRKIKKITAQAAKSPKYGQLLFRLVTFFQPKKILELGTSLGISTMYLGAVTNSANIITIEGSEAIAKEAKNNFNKLKLQNIEVINGSFEENLKPAIEKLERLDFVYIDGNHRKEPTLSYFEQCLLACHNESVIVLDDINWSVEMQDAWDMIKKHPQVTSTLDVFFMGIVFLRKELSKEHFLIRF